MAEIKSNNIFAFCPLIASRCKAFITLRVISSNTLFDSISAIFSFTWYHATSEVARDTPWSKFYMVQMILNETLRIHLWSTYDCASMTKDRRRCINVAPSVSYTHPHYRSEDIHPIFRSFFFWGIRPEHWMDVFTPVMRMRIAYRWCNINASESVLCHWCAIVIGS